ncbi:DUF7268 family protein [Halorussus caseinilyticus]|uniref:Uncharacterized protein n=1 Tax=Halorussus caseinilyticus TaxID=3034025 RepID=A0ABD5WM83_9EURY|nr:hypothetical protein [Halorussus sp. DT72]
MSSGDSGDSGDSTRGETIRDDSPTRRERARQLGRALAFGAVLAGLAVPVLVASGESVQFASEKVFAVGALVFGFSLLGWSGSVFAGRGIENFQRHIGGRSDWSEADSRRAMAVLGSVGVGGMVGASLATLVVGSVA